MKISVSCGGRFHGFDMASYFQEVGVLNQLVTGYPKYEAVKYGISKKNIRSIYINEIINRITNKLGLGYPLNTFSCKLYDYLTSLVISKKSDIYFLWSGFSLYTIRCIRKSNPSAKIVLVRGSSHILIQEELLKKISQNQKGIIDPKMIARELKEYELADFITIPSTFAFNSFVKLGFKKEKLFLNLLGVDLSQFPFSPKKSEETVTFGYVGSMSKQKNVESIIKKIEEAYQNNKKIRLILAGGIDIDSFSPELLKKPFIDYRGQLPQSELFKEYHKIDVFILNSVQDGFGMVLLQAMSCGCAIISTENTGGPDLIENYKNGIIIPAFDDEALKRAINWYIINKAEIKGTGARNRILSENGFTWGDFGKRNVEFAGEILKK